jgi:hypothetical protein
MGKGAMALQFYTGAGGGTPAVVGQCRWGLPAIGVWTGVGASLRRSTLLGGGAGDCPTGTDGEGEGCDCGEVGHVGAG